ncbi:hypothetical protein [Polaribacter sp. R77954]|uniref:hypothetical protein n=1 Tax=Polaribacter sp. R77954 TaxID=3093870 RepID=UPI0037C5E3D4
MLYYLLIAFQAFCIFHVYKTKNDYYWYIVIFFLPLIGGAVYLFTKILNKKNLDDTLNTITAVVNPTKKIKDLEQKLSFSETFQNKINLADAHLENNNFKSAIEFYEKALQGKYQQHPYTINKLLKCYFKIENFKKVIQYASKIDIEKTFRDSLCFYAIALEKCNLIDEAEVQFKKVDKRYSNYPERLELSRFLIRRDQKEAAKSVLNDVITEINNMIETNQRKYKYIYKESKLLMRDI